MVSHIKIAHFDPGSDGICPVGWPCQDLRKSRFMVFLGHFGKMVVYIFLGVPGYFLTENAFIERTQGASKNTLGASNSMGYSSYGRLKFQFLTQNLQDGRPKIAISRDSRHFFNFDVFLKAVPRGIQKSKRDLPNSCGTWDVAAESFNFIGKHEGNPNKNAIFSNLGFQTPWKPKMDHKEPLTRSFDRALSFFGVYQWA